MVAGKKRVLILGGGFAGMYTAKYLERLLRPEEAEISLVNRENYSVYQPMLPEVISGSIGITDVVAPIRRICPRSHLIMRDVEQIDLERRVVTVSPGFRPRRLELEYDYLVIALGGVTSFYGMPGMIENAMPFRTLADAIALPSPDPRPGRSGRGGGCGPAPAAADIRGGGRRLLRRRSDGRAERLRAQREAELLAAAR